MTFRCRTIFRLLFLATGAAVAILTVASAYGGVVNPAVTTIPAILAMTFPAWLTISVFTPDNQLIHNQKGSNPTGSRHRSLNTGHRRYNATQHMPRPTGRHKHVATHLFYDL